MCTLYLVFENSFFADTRVEDMFAHMRVHRTERVVQEVNVSRPVHSPSQAHTLLLATTQVDALRKQTKKII